MENNLLAQRNQIKLLYSDSIVIKQVLFSIGIQKPYHYTFSYTHHQALKYLTNYLVYINVIYMVYTELFFFNEAVLKL